MRINKYLASAGACSRREADRLIADGLITVNGKRADLGMEIDESDRVELRGERILLDAEDERVILAYNKPAGLICSASDKDGETIFDHIDYPKRLFSAGRLDKASRGLLLLTNDGDLADKLMRARNGHEREYIVSIDTIVSAQMIEKMRKGIYLRELEVKTKPCFVKKIDEHSFSIILKQGLNRQIRRMVSECGAHVTDLCRVRIENIQLGKLKEGTIRRIKNEEKESLLALINNGRKR